MGILKILDAVINPKIPEFSGKYLRRSAIF